MLLAQRTVSVAIVIVAAILIQRFAAAQTRPSKDAPPDSLVAYGYQDEPYKLPSGPHLFVDYRYIAAGSTAYTFPDGKDAPRFGGDVTQLPSIRSVPMHAPNNIRIEAQRADKSGVAIENDQPWEFMVGYPTLLKFDGKYRLWYEIVPPEEDKSNEFLCYAESTDGLKWTQPKLGIVDFAGSKENNIVYSAAFAHQPSFHGVSVFVDPVAPPERRLKMIYMASATEQDIAEFKAAHPASVSAIGERKKLFIRLAWSADGIHWTPQLLPLMSHMSDTQTTVYFDEILKRYVAYFRVGYMGRRAIGRSESADFQPWPAPKPTLFPQPLHDAIGDDYYISGYGRYPGTTTMHLMVATIFKRQTDTTELSLASSMDGEQWNWLPGGPVLEPGVDGSWDGGCIFGGINLTELPDGRVIFPYLGYRYPHKFPRWGEHIGKVGMASWPKERLAAIVADEDGEFTTIPLATAGSQLFLNFKTRHDGFVKIGIEGDTRRTIETCDPLSGDQAKKLVTWNGEGTAGVERSAQFRLRIKLRSAKLYSFEFR